MNFEVGIGGLYLPWRPIDIGIMEDWVVRGDWRSRVALVTCATGGEGAICGAVLRMLMHAIANVEPRVIEVQVSTRDLDNCIGEAIGAGPGRRAIAKKLIDSARFDFQLIILRINDRPMVRAEEAREFRDIAYKLDGDAQLMIVAILPDECQVHGAFHLSEGWPVHRVRVGVGGGEWSAYVHDRVAWHSGGRFDVALSLGKKVPPLREGEEAELGLALRDDARARFNAMDAELKQSLTGNLSSLVGNRFLQVRAGSVGEVGHHPLPIGWLATAILELNPRHPNREILRYSAACRPLALRLFGRVMALEAGIRDRLLSQTVGIQPPDQVQSNFDRVIQLSSVSEIEQRIIPRGFPHPESPWQLAGLGELLKLSGINAEHSPEGKLRRLRNALAHGSPVGWDAFAALEEIERALSFIDSAPSSSSPGRHAKAGSGARFR
jgi:hypothetical protein